MVTVIAGLILLALGCLLVLLWQGLHVAELYVHHRIKSDLDAKEERPQRRERARHELKRAIEFLEDPKNERLDYAFGTGHQAHRAEKILAAKSWEELEAIARGDDLDILKDKLYESDYFRKRDERDAEARKEKQVHTHKTE